MKDEKKFLRNKKPARLLTHQGTTNASINTFILRDVKLPAQYAHFGK